MTITETINEINTEEPIIVKHESDNLDKVTDSIRDNIEKGLELKPAAESIKEHEKYNYENEVKRYFKLDPDKPLPIKVTDSELKKELKQRSKEHTRTFVNVMCYTNTERLIRTAKRISEQDYLYPKTLKEVIIEGANHNFRFEDMNDIKLLLYCIESLNSCSEWYINNSEDNSEGV